LGISHPILLDFLKLHKIAQAMYCLLFGRMCYTPLLQQPVLGLPGQPVVTRGQPVVAMGQPVNGPDTDG